MDIIITTIMDICIGGGINMKVYESDDRIIAIYKEDREICMIYE